MTENEQATLEALGVSRETLFRLSEFVVMVEAEAEQQNLVSAATMPAIWLRHVIDSLQLLPLAPKQGSWLDIGTGAGFPGLAIAIASERHHVTLVEPRALRAAFLSRAADALGMKERVEVITSKVERVSAGPFDIISARAVARIDALFASATPVASKSTMWLLLKGRTARDELAAARQTWQGQFRLEPSITDAEAAIIVATGVQRRTKR